MAETFVDAAHHRGVSVRASNWIRVGRSVGRGRYSPTGTTVSVKTIFLYPLVKDWRAQFGIPALAPSEGLDCGTWAAAELGGAPCPLITNSQST